MGGDRTAVGSRRSNGGGGQEMGTAGTARAGVGTTWEAHQGLIQEASSPDKSHGQGDSLIGKVHNP